MMNTTLKGESNRWLSTANDFRKVVLWEINSGGSAATATTLRNTKAISNCPSGNFTVDEEINQATTGAVGKVVEYTQKYFILHTNKI